MNIFFVFTEFFEDTIAEEQYEAQKLDIMRDALRSKATYTIETKKMEKEERNFAPNVTSPPLSPTPPQEVPSPPVSPTKPQENGVDSHKINGIEPMIA